MSTMHCLDFESSELKIVLPGKKYRANENVMRKIGDYFKAENRVVLQGNYVE